MGNSSCRRDISVELFFVWLIRRTESRHFSGFALFFWWPSVDGYVLCYYSVSHYYCAKRSVEILHWALSLWWWTARKLL